MVYVYCYTTIMRLGADFFNRNTVTVARELLGKFLVRRRGRHTIAAMIIETEAYHGPSDRASHASRGLTPRTQVMFGPPGHTYVYLVYGMYHCLNFVTCREGFPAAVLIRAVQIVDGGQFPVARFQNKELKTKNPDPRANRDLKLKTILDGPGKLCKALDIDRLLNNLSPDNNKLWIEDHTPKLRLVCGKPRLVWSRLPRSRMIAGLRIGVAYAGQWARKPWRFVLHKKSA